MQLIVKAYIILNKTRRFKIPINEWNQKPDVDQTWNNSKVLFPMDGSITCNWLLTKKRTNE
jgi:hypothetical protein